MTSKNEMKLRMFGIAYGANPKRLDTFDLSKLYLQGEPRLSLVHGAVKFGLFPEDHLNEQQMKEACDRLLQKFGRNHHVRSAVLDVRSVADCPRSES